MTTQAITKQEIHAGIDALSDETIEKLALYEDALDYEDDDGFYIPANLRRLDHSIEQLKQGKVVVKTIEELERMADE